MFLFLFFSMLLPCSFFRLKELFQVKNGVTTSLVFFFLKMPKIWVGRTTVNRKKKEDDQNNVQRSVWRIFMSMVRSVIRNCYSVAEDSTEPFQSSPRPSYGKLIILIPF